MKVRRNNAVRLAVVAMAAAAISMTACTPEPGTGAPGWPAAGCIASSQPGTTLTPDIGFSGAPNVRGNGVLSGSWSNGQFVFSTNGSCSGVPMAAMTLVRADDQAAADALCAAAGAGTDPAEATAGSGYTLSTDAWACSETYFL